MIQVELPSSESAGEAAKRVTKFHNGDQLMELDIKTAIEQAEVRGEVRCVELLRSREAGMGSPGETFVRRRWADWLVRALAQRGAE